MAFDPNNPCRFCDASLHTILAETDLALLIKDDFPASKGHCLVIPKRHIATFFEATEDENRDFLILMKKAKALIDEQHQPDGYNIGSNNGVMAGQSVFHLHFHVIPRYEGDVENPRGGVRWVIPKKATYNNQK